MTAQEGACQNFGRLVQDQEDRQTRSRQAGEGRLVETLDCSASTGSATLAKSVQERESILAENSDGVGRFMAYRAATQRIGDRHAGERNVAIGAGLIIILAVLDGIIGGLAVMGNPDGWILIAAAIVHAGFGLALGYYKNTILALVYLGVSVLAWLSGLGSLFGIAAAGWVIRGTRQLDRVRSAEAESKT